MDREQIFHWLQNKDFNKIIDFLKTGKKTVAEDEIIQKAIGHIFTELINSSKENKNSETTLFLVSYLTYILISHHFLVFPLNNLNT